MSERLSGWRLIAGVASTRLDADEGGSLLKVQKPGGDFGGYPDQNCDRDSGCAILAFLAVIAGMLCAVPELATGMILVVAELGTALVMCCMD